MSEYSTARMNIVIHTSAFVSGRSSVDWYRVNESWSSILSVFYRETMEERLWMAPRASYRSIHRVMILGDAMRMDQLFRTIDNR